MYCSVVDLNVGGSTSNRPDIRNVARPNATTRWPGFIDTVIDPFVELFAEANDGDPEGTILLHNPWGLIENVAMDFDQWQCARGAGLDWLAEDYVEPWREFGAAYPGITMIDYLGSLRHNATLQGLVGQQRFGQYAQYVNQCVTESIAAGHGICFDAMGNSSEHQAENERGAVIAVGELLKATRLPLWVEASVPWADAIFRQFPMWVTWKTYERRHLSWRLHPAEVDKYPCWNRDGEMYKEWADLDYYGDLHVAVFRTEDFTEENVQTLLRNGHTPIVRNTDQFQRVAEVASAMEPPGTEASGALEDDGDEEAGGDDD